MKCWCFRPLFFQSEGVFEEFYPLDIDDSYLEYVISELKYVAIDILLLDVD